MIRICKDCGKEFQIGEKSQKFYRDNNLHLPTRCKCCRDNRKKNNINSGNELSDIYYVIILTDHMNNKETLFYNKSKINIKDLKLFSYQDIKECQFSKEQLDDCIEKLKRINELFQYKFDIKQLSA